MTFSALDLVEPILNAVTDTGYTQPTPIQARVIPAMLAGDDVVGIAQTGTGKTAAFVLPILNRLALDEERVSARRAKALVLVPTRELAIQIADGIATYGKHLDVTASVVVGGVKPGPQQRALARGVDVLIATPGRLLDHLGTGAVRLDRTHTVILDEADQMLDLGFMPAIRKIMAKLPNQRQTAMLSATMPGPIRKLAEDFLHNPVEVAVAPASKPIEKIEQSVCYVPASAKRAVLVQLLADPAVERAIVFTRTKHGADRVVKHLDQAGLLAAAIHGNKSQNNRQRTLDAFRSGKMPILVATDVAARGIDIDDVSHVINFELPNVAESYVHRIGRTARAGRSGIAIALCDPSERKHLRAIEKLTKIRLDEREIAIDDALAAEAAAMAQAVDERAARPAEKAGRDEVQDRSSHNRRSSQNRGSGQGRQRRPGDKHRSGDNNTQRQAASTRTDSTRRHQDSRQDKREDKRQDKDSDHRQRDRRQHAGGASAGASNGKGEQRQERPNHRSRDAQRANRRKHAGKKKANRGGGAPADNDNRAALMRILAS